LGWFVDPEEGGSIQPDKRRQNQLYVLVEAEDMGSITGLSELEESIDLVLAGTPEHDTDGNTSVLDRGRNFRVPKVKHLDAGRSGEERNPLVIAHGPSDGELSSTAGSVGRGLGFNGVGRLSSRRGRRQRRGKDILRGITGGLVLGSASWFGGGGGGGIPRLASLGGALLLDNTVVVGKVPGQVVRPHREGKGLGRSERAEEDSECG